jgi:hypothetical protein
LQPFHIAGKTVHLLKVLLAQNAETSFAGNKLPHFSGLKFRQLTLTTGSELLERLPDSSRSECQSFPTAGFFAATVRQWSGYPFSQCWHARTFPSLAQTACADTGGSLTSGTRAGRFTIRIALMQLLHCTYYTLKLY